MRRPTQTAQQLRTNATDAERHLWYRLRGRNFGGWKFCRQMPLGPYIVDFLCRERSLVVELDGGQHSENARDVRRDAFLRSQGYRVVRFWNHDVFENLDGVLETLNSILGDSPASEEKAP